MKPIFIFSLPRSGSTLLQRILATSAQISTVSEPWILLPFVYTIKAEGIRAEYGHSLSVQAIHDFYQHFPNGRNDYLHELREFALKLYEKSSQDSSIYFLDKTPRYHLIINEIIEIFPEGKFIFLWRNPLAVVASIINSWCKGKWKPKVWQLDLYNGTNNLLSSYRVNSAKVHSLQYEQLVQFPTSEIKKICEFLALDYNPQMLESFQNISLDGKLGDKTGIKKYNSLSNNSIHNWKESFNNPIRRNWAIKYLDWLGEENLKTMGYNYGDIIELVSNGKNINFNDMISDLFRSVINPIANIPTISEANSHKPIKHQYY